MNVKGRNFSYELGALSILVGANASGKTAATDAITVAALGYHPALGKKPAPTMALAPDSARQMEVEVRMMNGNGIRRTFTRTKTGASLKDVGEPPTMVPAQLYFAEFTQAKATERHAVLNSLMGAIDYDGLADRVKAKMAELALADMIEGKIDPNADHPLADFIEQLAEQGRQLKQSVDATRKTLGTLSVQDIPPAVSTAEVTAHEQAVAEANRRVGAAVATLDQLNERVVRAPDEPSEKRPSAGDLDLARNELRAAEDALTQAKAAKQQETLLVQQKAAWSRRDNQLAMAAQPAKAPKPTMSIMEVSKERAKLQEEEREAQRLLTEQAQAVGRNKQEADGLAKSIHQLKEHGTCPCCGTTGQNLEAAMARLIDQEAAARQIATETEASAASAKRGTQARQDRLAELAAIDVQIAAWEAREDLEEHRKTTPPETSATDINAAEQLVRDRSATHKALHELEAEWVAYTAAQIPTAQQLAAATKEAEDARDASSLANDALGTIRAQRAAHDQALADQQRIQEMTKTADDTEDLLKRVLALREFLLDEQRAATAEAMKPLLKIAGVFLNGLVKGELAVREHQVGIQRFDQFLPLEVLSGMEMTAVAAACQAALATKGDLPILIIDELGKMVPSNRAIFAENCQRAIEAGIISQAILLDQAADHHTVRNATLIPIE